MILTVVLASLAVYSWKLLGYLVPARLISDKMRLLSERITIALLAALVAIQGFTSEQDLVIDARLPALLVAALLLFLRVPYIVVVAAGALTAAGLRLLGF